MARRHDQDAGGSPELLDAKAQLREQVWSALREQQQARFPGAHGRIPNVVGAEAAADRLPRARSRALPTTSGWTCW